MIDRCRCRRRFGVHPLVYVFLVSALMWVGLYFAIDAIVESIQSQP